MNTPTLTLPASLMSLRQRGAAWWHSLSPRDRRIGTLGVVVAGVVLLWGVALQPAWRVLREAPRQVERLDAQTQQMQLLAAEARTLRGAPQVAPAQATAALKAAVGRLGDKARLAQQGERATVTFSGIDGAALGSFLAEARGTARARPVEAQLVRGPLGYDGTLIMSLGGPP
jgi:general secretion pathway protein M